MFLGGKLDYASTKAVNVGKYNKFLCVFKSKDNLKRQAIMENEPQKKPGLSKTTRGEHGKLIFG